MSTWHTIYQGGVDDPVRANPDAFYSESSNATNTATTIRYVSDEFSKIRYGRSDGFRGATADAFADKARDWQTKLEPTAQVFTDVSNILSSHAGRLSQLRSEATVAASKALAVWKLRNAARQLASSAATGVSTAQGDVAHAQKQLKWIRTQIAALPPADPTTAVVLPKYQAQESSWQQELTDRSNRLRRQKSDLASAQADEKTYNDQLTDWFSGSRSNSWQSLRNREDQLNSETVNRIKGIDLRGAEDPGWWQEHLSDFAGWIKNAATAIKNAIEAAITALVRALKLILEIVAKIVVALVIMVAVIAVLLAIIYLIAMLMPVIVAVVTVLVRIIVGILIRYAVRWIITQLAGFVDGAAKTIQLDAEKFFSMFTGQRMDLGHKPASTTPAGRIRAMIASDPEGSATYTKAYAYNRLSDDAYNDNPGDLGPGMEDWSRLSDAELRSSGIDPRWLDNSLSGFHASIYRNAETGEVCVAFRGSEPTDLRDWAIGDLGDFLFGAGNPISQQDQAQHLAKLVAAKFGPENVVFTGHSLGGDLAAEAAIITGGSAVTWNAKGVDLGHLGFGTRNAQVEAVANERILNFRVEGEALSDVNHASTIVKPGSGLQEIGKNVIVQPDVSGLNPIERHSLDHFRRPAQYRERPSSSLNEAILV